MKTIASRLTEEQEHSKACERIQSAQVPGLTKARHHHFMWHPDLKQRYLTTHPLSYARWLIEFTRCNLTTLSPQGWRALQHEVLVFAYSGIMVTNETTGKLGKPLPSKAALREMHTSLSQLFGDLTKEKVIPVSTKGWQGFLMMHDGAVDGWTNAFRLPWHEAFMLHVFTTLTDPDVQRHFRVCRNEPCRRPFLAHKRQAYCSPICSQRHRTHLYRIKNRERFRAKRREYYARKQREQIGSPNVRIQTRKGVR